VLLLADVCVIGLAAGQVGDVHLYAAHGGHAGARPAHLGGSAPHDAVCLGGAAIAVAASAGVAITGSTHLNGYVYFMLFALLLISPLAIGRRIVMSRRVTLRLLVAAICVYLMIGLLFTFVYLGVNGVHPASSPRETRKILDLPLFQLHHHDDCGIRRLYAGMVAAPVLVVFEAMLGQVFLVTAVARLVSLYSSESRTRAAVDDAVDDG